MWAVRRIALLLFLMLSPSLVWILRDRSVWDSDSAIFGVSSLLLHHTLTHRELSWSQAMLDVGPKPPLLPWLGQFVVPAGRLVGHVESGLLLVPFLALLGGLCLLYQAQRAQFGERTSAVAGCLSVAAAPVAIEMSKQFYVQTLQFLAVAWFLYIMASARRWPRWSVAAQLAGAASLAMLTVASSIAFVIVPVAVALQAMRRNAAAPRLEWDFRHIFVLMVSGTLIVLTLFWYAGNFSESMAYAQWAYDYAYGGVAGGWFARLLVWLALIAGGALLPTVIVAAGTVLAISLRVRPVSDDDRKDAAFIILSALQIALALVILTGSAQQNFRYVLPLLAYFAMIAGWTVARIARASYRNALVALLAIQLVAVHSPIFVALGWTRPLQPTRVRTHELIDAAIDAMQSDDRAGFVVTATSPVGFYHSQLEFAAAKDPDYFVRFFAGRHRRYGSAEFMLTANNTAPIEERDRAVATIERDATFVILANPQLTAAYLEQLSATAPPWGDPGWHSLITAGAAVADALRASAAFERVAVPEAPELELYRRPITSPGQ